jgi:hypothetical protein
MTALRPFSELVERCNTLFETGSPFSQTAHSLVVVAPLSVPIKIFLLMIQPVKLGGTFSKARIIRVSLFNSFMV